MYEAASSPLGHMLTTPFNRLATAEPIRADALPPGTIEIVPDEAAFEERIQSLVEKFTSSFSSQPQALGKWAFWTQAGFQSDSTGDGYEDAVRWAGGAMALHARGEDAQEGMQAFGEKRTPNWKT